MAKGSISLTRSERRRLRQALFLAIDYQESSLDSLRVSYNRNKRGEGRTIPREHRPVASRLKRDCEAFRKLLFRLKGEGGKN